jgi:response regulator RpfG family c-di-GMP phosphodiesterase
MYHADILVINDGSKLLRMLGCVLESKGCRTLVTDRVREAFDKFNSQSFDLVIMKLTRNRIDSLPMLMIIKEMRPDTQLILLGDNLALSEDLQEAVSDFIALPCKVAEIWQRIRSQLDFRMRANLSAKFQPGSPSKELLSKLSLMSYKVRGSLLSISSGVGALGNGSDYHHQEAFEAVVQETQKRIAKLVAVTEEVINSFLILEELSEDLVPKRQAGPSLSL